jgi:hypothetical protein
MPNTSHQGASAQRRRRLPFNRFLLVGLVALVGVSTTSCQRGQAWVARVNGHEVAPANFAKGISLYSKLAGTAAKPTETAAPEFVLDNSEAGKYALLLVEARVIRELNDQHGTKVTDADRTKTREQLISQDQAGTLKKMPKWFQDQLIGLQADYAALVAYYGKGVDLEAQAKKYYAANKPQFDQFCIDVIATRTQADALAALKRIDGGEDFATVAKDVAKASGSQAAGDKQDGSVGCIPIANIAQAIPDKTQFDQVANAADGQVVGPLSQTGGAYLILRKNSVKTQTYAEVRTSILSTLGTPGNDEATKALNAYLAKADIELNPRYGTWTKGKGYAAPTGAEQPAGKKASTTSVVPTGATP